MKRSVGGAHVLLIEASEVDQVNDRFDLMDFWQESEYAKETYTEPAPSDQTVAEVERELGYRLPAFHLALARIQNGGTPRRTQYRTTQPTSWADDHVAISGIFSIGRTKPHSLAGACGSAFWISEWGYPPIGVYFADCPSAGHDMLCLDYRACGPGGEPRVVHVDQERDYEVTFVADSFESFVRGLESDSAFSRQGDTNA